MFKMMSSTVMTLFFVTAVNAANLWSNYTYEDYVRDFDLVYEAERETVFRENMHKIRAQNEAYNAGQSSWFAGVNKFVDRTEEEMSRFRGRQVYYAPTTTFSSVSSKNLPSSVDWRDKGVVTPPKNQGGCGSCWAFSTTETVESHVAIATGTLPILSPQELVSCMDNPDSCGGTGGCEGATAVLGFGYVTEYGLSSESDYPYEGRDERCSKPSSPTAKVNGTVQLKSNDADALMQAVATVGPVSISVAPKTWGFYSGGVFDGRMGSHCDVDIDHAVQLVGYGKDSDTGKYYWLVRNSWGESWGEDGYIRVLRTPGNEPCDYDTTPLDGNCGKSGSCKCPDKVQYCGTCGILSESSYPTGASLV